MTGQPEYVMDFTTYWNPGTDTIKLRVEPLGVVAEIYVEGVARQLAELLGARLVFRPD